MITERDVGAEAIELDEQAVEQLYELRPELRLAERMIERALATGARVVPVDGAAELLGTPDGVAALLRW